MLHEFLTTHRSDLIDRCEMKVAKRLGRRTMTASSSHGIPLFLDQLVKTLQVEQTANPMLSLRISGSSGGERVADSEIGAAAALHGRELLRQGFTVDQVVHDYGDLCQAITDLAYETGAIIKIDEFRTLNRCLDNGIAEAVTEFAFQRGSMMSSEGVLALNERLGFLAHELRNLVHTATLAVSAIKAGKVGFDGATGAVLDRSLIGLSSLIDRSLADVRVTAGLAPLRKLISVADLIAEAEVSAALEARTKSCELSVSPVDPSLAVEADRDMLLAAVGNLLQNAFKFTLPGTEVSLSAYAADDQIIIEVADQCGGLPPGATDSMFQPFKQSGADRSGMGLGLAISRRSVQANDGTITVRDAPPIGCVFSINLPQHVLP